MATFKLVLDTRFKKKNEMYNLAVRVISGNDVMFINITSLSKKQYEQVFERKLMDKNSIDFRESCNQFLSKCERIYAELKPFNKTHFREKVFEEERVIPTSLLLKDLFLDYIKNNEDNKIRTKDHYRTSMNMFESFKPGTSVFDITPSYLKKFEKARLKTGCSLATVNSYQRHLRSIINHYTNVEKIIPKTYDYPFGKSGYSISSYFPSKLVLKQQEIINVIEFDEFENDEQEYALSIWKILYYCNGSNFADLLQLKWSDINGEFIKFFRKKTENTRKNNIQPVIVPVIPDLKILIDKVGVKKSPFILGKLKEDYKENTFKNKCHKMKQAINKDLTIISKKLNLSIPLKLETARDCYATSLMRAEVSHGEISKMLNHSNVIVTEHYLGGLSMEKTEVINRNLVTRKN